MEYCFRCQKCKKKNIKIEHRITEPHPKIHSGCGGKLIHVIAKPNVVYKGAGFFTTDTRIYKDGD